MIRKQFLKAVILVFGFEVLVLFADSGVDYYPHGSRLIPVLFDSSK